MTHLYILVTKSYKSRNISKDLFQNAISIAGFDFEEQSLILIVEMSNFKSSGQVTCVYIFFKNLLGRILCAVIVVILKTVTNFTHLKAVWSTFKFNSSFKNFPIS